MLLEAKRAAGKWSAGSLKPQPPFLMKAFAQNQPSSVMGTWMIPPKAVCWRGLHPLSTKVEADWEGHRAGMII